MIDHVHLPVLLIDNVEVSTITFDADGEVGISVMIGPAHYVTTLPPDTDPALVDRLALAFALKQAAWLGYPIQFFGAMITPAERPMIEDVRAAVLASLESEALLTRLTVH